MKRIFYTFLITLLIGLSANAQSENKAKEDLERAKPFLLKDDCNSTGISWVKSALKRDSNNIEAQELLNKCTDSRYDSAISILKENPTDFKAIGELEKLVELDRYNTEETNFLLAKSLLEKNGANHYVHTYITKAISFNPNNNEYRWIRTRCNLTSSSTGEDFTQAITDLTFMTENGAESAKVYANLGLANQELADYIYRYEKAEKNDSYTDDNSKYIKEQTEIYNKAITNYKDAIKAFRKSIESGYENASKLEYRIKDCESYIAELQTKIDNLK